MSTLIKVKQAVKNVPAFEAACERLGLELKAPGTYNVWNRPTKGRGLRLPGWKYDIVVEEGGTIAYDNHNGGWGKMTELDALMQQYGLTSLEAEARQYGHLLETPTVNAEGEIEIYMEMADL